MGIVSTNRGEHTIHSHGIVVAARKKIIEDLYTQAVRQEEDIGL